MLFKLYSGCQEDIHRKDFHFLIGIVSIGIEECGFSTEPTSRAAYARGMFSLTPDMMRDLSAAIHLQQGQSFAKGLQCTASLKQLTANGVSYLKNHP